MMTELPTATVTVSSITTSVLGRGKIEPKRQINLRATIDGIVKEILVKEGQMVNKDQCLAKIEINPDIQLRLLNLKNRIIRNDIEKEELADQLTFQKKLYKEGLVSKIEIEQLEKKKNVVNETESVLNSERQLLEKQLGTQLSKDSLLGDDFSKLTTACIQSTIDGTVLQININVNDRIAVSFGGNDPPIMAIGDLSEYYINYRASEIDLSRIKESQHVAITTDSWPDKVISGTIESIASISTQIGSMDVMGPFANPSQQLSYYTAKIRIIDSAPELRPGLSCRISINTATKQGILVVPATSVYSIDSMEKYVFVKEAEDYRRRQVQIGIGNIDYVEIVSGLHKGETISLTPYKVIEQRKIIQTTRSKSLIEKILN